MTNLNQTIIEETFGQAYNRDKFTHFARELLNGMEYRGKSCPLIPAQFKDYIQSYYRVGKYVYNDGFEKIIDVLEVKLKRNSSVEHARAMQRNFIARYLNGAFGDIKRDAALVAFISEGSSDWRFSFVKMDYKSKIITENGKQKRIIEKELTPAKRFSFLVGENEYSHTAQKQLFECLSKASEGKQITLEDLVETFDIEKVSNEFFAEYKKLYICLRDELKRIYNFDVKIHKDFDKHEIIIDDFAKKTLGQLVFLYFIQKKGWLGVKSGEQWGSGDKRFLRNLFEKKYVEYDNFFNDILEPLFYRALARDRGNENDNFAPLNCRIPFLNGGLFEPINGYGYAQTDLTIDNAIFKEIFNVFDLYNFTVKEDEPLEKEVAIDPEMLGKVFENLLPENERKGNGAFYTPREIVHYMCQESLINYLYNAVNTKKLTPSQAKQGVLFTKKKAKQTDLDLEQFEEIVSKEDISTFIKLGESTYTNSNRGINEDLPSSIKENAVKINQALKDVKICDPAIGSGAFPVGMMNEIVRARLALGVENKTAYQVKREIIENNLYGVDLDDGAVEIAKLRFWLSLIVDEEDISNIRPLPNLDYKVMQGNSLISSYEGIDFDEIVENYKPKAVQLDFDYYGTGSDNIIKNINSDMYAYIKASHDTDKQEIRSRIEQGIVDLVRNKVEEKARQGGIKWEQAEQTIRDFAQNNKHRNFFPWKLFFADVFMNGGFDIVIANPPYLKERDHQKEFDPVNKSEFGKKYHQGKMDFWYYFLHKAIDITPSNGIITFITPRYWLNSAGAKKIIKRVKENLSFVDLVDIGKLKVFEDVAGYHMTATYCKTKKHDIFKYHKLENDVKYINGADDNENKITMELSNDSIYSDNNEIILSETKVLNIKTTPLSNECDVIQGVVQNPDKINKKKSETYGFELNAGVFVLTRDELDKLNLTNDEHKFVKVFLEENAINKYYVDDQSNRKYLLYLTKDNCKDINSYPNIKKHLLKYKVIMDNRRETLNGSNQWYHLHWPRKQELFEQEKIVIPSMFTENKVGYDNKNCYFGMSTNVLVISKKAKYSLKTILGILNSSYALNWFNINGKKRGAGVDIGVDKLRSFPIPNCIKNEEIINSLVDKIIETINAEDYPKNILKQQAVKEYEDKIDVIIYKLYDLTYPEVLTIDKDFKLSEKEYNEYKLT